MQKQATNKNHFKPAQKLKILQSFTLYDLNNDGRLSAKEVTNLIKRMLPLTSDTPILKLLSEIDSRQKGYLRKEEFVLLMERLMMTVTSEKDMQESFKIFEKTGEKCITFQSLREVLRQSETTLSEEDIRQLLAQLDEDKDGKITFQEFKRFMNR